MNFSIVGVKHKIHELFHRGGIPEHFPRGGDSELFHRGEV
jgi:hypothetical protein